ncbi:MAG: transcriptional repressor [Bacteroidales bacterium]|jgi:Fur family ferric uptake transcriptional regulator|nr:transcriptional repressor [Bacteroidales bacterium]MDD2571075.1 transcriptional repressor [Bacteroidales bacterium]MDD2812418.1 transcriptional repressor [Bacteroidales bacterium]MDD3384757.1 transcriptional repressor [Bacteroidales bacterium]MDD3811506.1 transcriptional repressor [Bacteroidales bacterium]
MGCKEIQATVRQIFSNYIEKKGLRKTPERFAILDEVYARTGHFDVETLYIQMKNASYQVSRATLYNTMDLLIDCGLVVKHQFGKNIAQFEKTYRCRQHDHIICTSCGKVEEYCDPRVHEIENTVAQVLDYTITKHSLYFYGICSDCRKKNKT